MVKTFLVSGDFVIFIVGCFIGCLVSSLVVLGCVSIDIVVVGCIIVVFVISCVVACVVEYLPYKKVQCSVIQLDHIFKIINTKLQLYSCSMQSTINKQI